MSEANVVAIKEVQNNTASGSEGVQSSFGLLPIKDVAANPDNARKLQNMAPERKAKLEELKASIREKGVLQPVLVRPAKEEEEGKYVVMAGDRRRLAVFTIAEEDGTLETALIPAILRSGDSEESAHDIMLTENLDRENLTEFEEARAFQRYFDQFGYTGRTAHREVAQKFGVTTGHVRQRLKLLTMPERVLAAWRNGDLTASHVEELTRLSEESDILKHLTFCLQGGRLPTVKELKERIEQDVPELKFAKFDTAECSTCAMNSQQQKTLFVVGEEAEVGAKCLKPACFIQKQRIFFTENWTKGKGKKVLGTNGFIFKHELTADQREVIKTDEPHATCLNCEKLVSTVTVAGKVVENRICVGPKACFEELYVAKPEPIKKKAIAKEDKTKTKATPQPSGGGKETKAGPTKEKPKITPLKAQEAAEKAVKRAKQHGEAQRERVFKNIIPEKVAHLDKEGFLAKRIALLGLLLANSDAAKHFAKTQGSEKDHFYDDQKGQLAALVFNAPEKDIMSGLVEAALLPIMNDATYNATSAPSVRVEVAEALGIDLADEWVVTKDYLDGKMKSEIFRLGEELDFWSDAKALIYKEAHFPKKAIMSLKKDEMIDLILKSGLDLTGKVPEEVLDTSK